MFANNLLPGVPHVESPFFEQIFSDSDPETARVARELHTRGFAVIDFPEPDFGRLAERIKADLEPRYDWAEWREHPTWGLRIQDAWSFNADVRRLAANAHVRALLKRLYGREAFPFQTLNFPVGTQQHYHTDSIHFSSMPERFMCGVWLALEDVGPDQGPLIYYPGSHRWPFFGNEHVGHTATLAPHNGQSTYEPLWRELVKASGVKPERFHARAGQALIWAANLLHGGDEQTDLGKTRWSQVTHYYFADCAYYTPMLSDLPLGSVHFRVPVDISTDEPRANMYNGLAVPGDFIEHTSGAVTRRNFGDVGAVDFDGVAYLAVNPDVAAAGLDPLWHYQMYGRREGRPTSAG